MNDSRTHNALQLKQVGGKAFQLNRLDSISSLKVPDWRVLQVVWFEEHLALLPRSVVQKVLQPMNGDNNHPAGVDDGDCQMVREAVMNTPCSEKFSGHLREVLKGFPADSRISVRSSATSEDGETSSFAGQFETFLNVPVEWDTVAWAVKKCWASVFSQRVATYIQSNRMTWPGMAVVLQQMIPAEVAGIGFSINPTTGNTEEAIISATYGLGEGLVSGRYGGDQFIISKNIPMYQEVLENKTHQLVAGGGNGKQESYIGEVEVEASLQNKSCLQETKLFALREALLTIEQAFQKPVDIEFAIWKDGLYLLQTRSITASSDGERAGWGEKILWDNSNIVESYSGITLPLTFSFINFAYREVYEQFGRMLGVSSRVHRENQRTLRTYLGLIRGRVYYNLYTWYTSFSYLPFFSYTSAAMEAMMGLPESVNIKMFSGVKTQAAQDLKHKIKLIAKCFYYLISAQRIVRKFQDHFKKEFSRFESRQFQNHTPQQILNVYEELKIRFLQKWQAPILADTLAMVFYNGLEKLCDKWLLQKGIQNDLLSGQGGVESLEPMKNILAFFAEHKDKTAFRESLKARTPEEWVRDYRTRRTPEFHYVWQWLDGYLLQFGSRSMNELKLEEPTLSEQPAFIFQTLKNYFANPELALQSTGHSAPAQKELRSQLDEKLQNPLKKWIFLWTWKQAQRHIKNREAMRFARSRVYSLVRRLFVSYGETLAQAGLLKEPGDVFYLTVDELQTYAEGRSVTQSLASLVSLRKKEYQEFLDDEPDDRFFTVGLPYFKQNYKSARTLKNADGHILSGTCCCPGKVTGTVRVIQSPRDNLSLKGEILAASRTDPGWIPLYPSISGLLIEKGSVLSHSAIVAREMGIPTIVGIDNLIQRLKDGDAVAMDAQAGTVQLMDKK